MSLSLTPIQIFRGFRRDFHAKPKRISRKKNYLVTRSFYWLSIVGTLGVLGACKNFDNKQDLAEVTAIENEDQAAQGLLEEALVSKDLTTDCPTNQVCVTILALNDVYEIDAVGGGAYGGLDRVATIRKALAKNPAAGPVLTMIAGDFFNPSGLGSIKEDGRAWAGRHMISTLKAAGLDFAMLGNHEFDLSWADFKARLDKSVSPPNVFAASGASGVFDANLKEDIPFKTLGEPIPQARILQIKRGNLSFNLGLIALTLNKNQKDYQRFTDVEETARLLPTLIRKKINANPADRVVAITHVL
jgi:2',3'-cyclic-nucleotide 2'-phosphodiesterase (5'-nucleotidase family)